MAVRLAPHDLADVLTKGQRDCLVALAADATCERTAGNRRRGMINAMITAELLERGYSRRPSWSHRKGYYSDYTLTARGRSVLSVLEAVQS